MIPGLEEAAFERYGQMHRNTFIASPSLLDETLAFKKLPGLFAAGQLTGIEGYAGNIASGLVAGINAARWMNHLEPLVLPETTMTGALIHYITHASLDDFQPMKAMFGLLPGPPEGNNMKKQDRYAYYAERALQDLELLISS
jgi:methylenetetrahydrofolate--tRNA-(uracil-5-)-methyltransferase